MSTNGRLVHGHNSCWTFRPFISILHGHSIHWTPHHRPNVRRPIIHGYINNAPWVTYLPFPMSSHPVRSTTEWLTISWKRLHFSKFPSYLLLPPNKVIGVKNTVEWSKAVLYAAHFYCPIRTNISSCSGNYFCIFKVTVSREIRLASKWFH